MRCSCGAPARIKVPRRDMPYCDTCFEHMLSGLVRAEVGQSVVRLQPRPGFFLDAATAACKLARREVVLDEEGLVPGCCETQAAAIMRQLLQNAPAERHFPNSITLQELQTFFKAEPPALDTLTKELIEFDKQYPGTTRSIAKQEGRGP